MQYLPNKPIKYGIKIYAIADRESGYLKPQYVHSGKFDIKNTD